MREKRVEEDANKPRRTIEDEEKKGGRSGMLYRKKREKKTGPRFDMRRAVFMPVGMASSPLTA